jgi:hypothetical protein
MLNIYNVYILFDATDDFKSQIDNTGKRKSFCLLIMLIFVFIIIIYKFEVHMSTVGCL